MEKCKVLFLAANPNATERLALDEEVREIESMIRASSFRDSLSLVSKWAVRPDDLLQGLNEHKPQIVHFSGHGNAENALLLQSDDGTVNAVSDAVLSKLFEIFRNDIRLVVLNACFSLGQANSIARSIDCTVGMNTAIGDKSAIAFAASFYRALGFGCSVQDAFEQGRIAIQLSKPDARVKRGASFGGKSLSIGEHSTPTLIVREGIDPREIILVAPTDKAKPAADNRSVSIGGNVTGGVFVTGNQNVVAQRNEISKTTVDHSVDIVQLFTQLRKALTSISPENQLNQKDQKKITRAFDDIHDELDSPNPDRQEIGHALDRVLRIANSDSTVAKMLETSSDHQNSLSAITNWLGNA